MTNTFYASAFLGPAKTANYKPSLLSNFGGYGSTTQGQLPFTISLVPEMVLDPAVSFGLAVIWAPLYSVKWKVNCKDAEAALFIDKTLKKFWKNDLRKCRRMLEYGVAGGEPLYKVKEERFVYDELRDIHPLDLWPMMDEGKLAGVRVEKALTDDGEKVILQKPKMFWIAHDPQFGSPWGTKRLQGCHEPWKEKRNKGGAVDIRRLWFLKNAFDGGVMRYPPGSTIVNGVTRNNEDIANEILEKKKTGGFMAMPSEYNNLVGQFTWLFESPKSNGDIDGIRDYPHDLDEEIWTGLGVPVELIRASETGSGYAGRAVPADVFFRSEDQLAASIIAAVDTYICRPLVKANYGDVDYEIEMESLTEQMKQQAQPQAGMRPGQPMPQQNGSNGYRPSPTNPAGNPAKLPQPVQKQLTYESKSGGSSGSSSKLFSGLSERLRERSKMLAESLLTAPKDEGTSKDDVV